MKGLALSLGSGEPAARRFAEVWYNTYGNDDIYYSEKEGCCTARDNGVQPIERTLLDSGGNRITELIYPEGYQDIWDQAHEQWNRGERCLVLETREGYRLFVDCFPSIGVVFSHNGQFALPEEDMAALCALLN